MIKLILPAVLCLNLFANQIELDGTVVSDNEKMITSRNMGYIKEVYVKEGSNYYLCDENGIKTSTDPVTPTTNNLVKYT